MCVCQRTRRKFHSFDLSFLTFPQSHMFSIVTRLFTHVLETQASSEILVHVCGRLKADKLLLYFKLVRLGQQTAASSCSIRQGVCLHPYRSHFNNSWVSSSLSGMVSYGLSVPNKFCAVHFWGHS